MTEPCMSFAATFFLSAANGAEMHRALFIGIDDHSAKAWSSRRLSDRNLRRLSLNGRPSREMSKQSETFRMHVPKSRLNAGVILNLREDCELTGITFVNPAVRLLATRLNGLTALDTLIVEGENVDPDDLFELENCL
jgi:hypothetical protein